MEDCQMENCWNYGN